jgi:catechol 2,3-dioxygenase-like lactoylglutathione lyase family enzyme
MPILDIHHVAIKTLDLEATNQFYVDLLGMTEVARPPFDFPGSWLSMGRTMLHIFAGKSAFDRSGEFHPGSAAIDHISIQAQDFNSYRKAFRERGLDYRELDHRPMVDLWQLFVHDPNGVLIELNFSPDGEPAGAASPDRDNPYLPGRF